MTQNNQKEKMNFYLKVFKIHCPKCYSISETVVQRYYVSKNQIRRGNFEKQNIVGFNCTNCGSQKKVDENIINLNNLKI